MCEPCHEIRELRQDMQKEFAELRKDIHEKSATRQEMHEGFAKLHREMHEKFATRQEMHEGFAKLHREMHEKFATRQEMHEGFERVIRKTRVLLESLAAEVKLMIEGVDTRDKVTQLDTRVTKLEEHATRTDMRVHVLEKGTDGQTD